MTLFCVVGGFGKSGTSRVNRIFYSRLLENYRLMNDNRRDLQTIAYIWAKKTCDSISSSAHLLVAEAKLYMRSSAIFDGQEYAYKQNLKFRKIVY